MLTATIKKDVGEIEITFLNRLDKKVVLPAASPIEFLTLSGDLIYSPLSTQMLTELSPGEEKSWTFNLEEIGLSQYLERGFVVKLRLVEPRDEVFLIIKTKKA